MRITGLKNLITFAYYHIENFNLTLHSTESKKSDQSESHDTKTPLYDPGIGILIFDLNFFPHLL